MNKAVPPPRPEKVHFFATCLVDLFYPSVGLAGMELLRNAGLKVTLRQGQSCCGQPAFSGGYSEEAREVARAQLDAFSGEEPIVVPSGSCAGMMRSRYPELFKGDRDERKALAFSERVYELTWFLVHVLKVKLEDKGEPIRVTWHGSCQSLREAGVDEEPKRLLRDLANVTLIEAEYEKECCGFGGSFSIRMPEISGAIVSDKIANIGATGAREVLSGDMGCMMNISGAMAKARMNVRGRHIAEFLLERTKGEGAR